jgi:hypothetical protein
MRKEKQGTQDQLVLNAVDETDRESSNLRAWGSEGLRLVREFTKVAGHVCDAHDARRREAL